MSCTRWYVSYCHFHMFKVPGYALQQLNYKSSFNKIVQCFEAEISSSKNFSSKTKDKLKIRKLQFNLPSWHLKQTYIFSNGNKINFLAWSWKKRTEIFGHDLGKKRTSFKEKRTSFKDSFLRAFDLFSCGNWVVSNLLHSRFKVLRCISIEKLAIDPLEPSTFPSEVA